MIDCVSQCWQVQTKLKSCLAPQNVGAILALPAFTISFHYRWRCRRKSWLSAADEELKQELNSANTKAEENPSDPVRPCPLIVNTVHVHVLILDTDLVICTKTGKIDDDGHGHDQSEYCTFVENVPVSTRESV
jgi:hypothetical protein